MAKLKNKSHSEVEHLRGIVKELKKENGQLRRQLKESTKLKHFYDDVKDDYEEYVAEEETSTEQIQKVAKCPSCFSGDLNLVLDLNDKDIFVCSECEFRKVVKK